MNTLIIEQHATVGGYCTSFKRKGYNFDSAVHYLGGISRGSLSKILKDFDSGDDLKFSQLDPTDKIIMPDLSVYIRANPHDTASEFKKCFPKEKTAIEKFFNFLMGKSVLDIHRHTFNMSFKEVLDLFLKDERLKSAFSALLLGNLGMTPSKISGFASVIFFREFLLDPGYYPSGGMLKFALFFANKFKEYGGKILLSHRADKILLDNNVVSGVKIESGEKFSSKFVVSGIDATQTYKCLINKDSKESKTVDNLVPSDSVFILYLGLNTTLENILNEKCNFWLFPEYNLEKNFAYGEENNKNEKSPVIMFSSPSIKDPTVNNSSKCTAEIFSNAIYKTKDFWNKNRSLVAEEMLSLVEKNLSSNIRKHIDCSITATPATLYRYTLNREGSAYGWASTIKQTESSSLPQMSSLKNLFLVGHWATMGGGQGGISTVSLSGKVASEMIIHRFRNEKNL